MKDVISVDGTEWNIISVDGHESVESFVSSQMADMDIYPRTLPQKKEDSLRTVWAIFHPPVSVEQEPTKPPKSGVKK